VIFAHFDIILEIMKGGREVGPEEAGRFDNANLVGLNIWIFRMSNHAAPAFKTRRREPTMIPPFITLIFLSRLGLSCVAAPFVGAAGSQESLQEGIE